jgi:hypothetical protein
MPHVYLCAGFSDVTANIGPGHEVTFTAVALDIALPEKDSSGNQSLVFAIDNITGEAQRFVDTALAAGGEMLLIYREYLASDLSEPASVPKTLNIIGGVFEGGTFQAEASYYDMLNTAWPRDRYTADYAPGIKYMA